jgi:3-hydroxybutyryl-CoA dehydrogenase
MSDERPRTVAVIGAGLMGHAIAQTFALAGSSVRVWDPHESALRSVPARIRANLDAVGSSVDVDVTLATSLAAAVSDTDLVVEAIPEVLALKQGLMVELDGLAPDAVVATNTSVLTIADIAATCARAERVIGAHWWNPPHLISVVEIVRGPATTDDVQARLLAWLRAVGKQPVVVRQDVPGFVGNRMQFALWREAMAIVEQGICDAETVDLVARETFGRRLATIGPLENADLIGLELTSAIMDYVLPHLAAGTSTPRLVRDALANGRAGAASGAGLLDWPEGGYARTRARLAQHLVASEAATR